MPKQNKTYQSLSAELDEILAKLQAPDVDVDEALKLYERGQKVAQELEQYLRTTENKIRKLSGGV